MATSTYGTPYVQGSDLVSAYPTVSSSLATRVDEVSYKGNGLNAQTGTTYTLVAGDAGKTITLSNASPVAVTLPQDSTADLPDGAVVTFYNLGAGTVTISQGTGATLQGGSITLLQYEVTTVIKLSANTYGRFDGGGNAGLVPVTPTSIANVTGTATLSASTVTFTGVASVSLNGIFSATFLNYAAVLNVDSVSTTMNVNMRLRAAGSDNSSSNYYYNGTEVATSSATTVQTARSIGLTTSFNTGIFTNALGSSFINIFNPFESQKTRMTASAAASGDTDLLARMMGGLMSVTTSYDGLTILTSTGTMTGNVTFFGYKK